MGRQLGGEGMAMLFLCDGVGRLLSTAKPVNPDAPIGGSDPETQAVESTLVSGGVLTEYEENR